MATKEEKYKSELKALNKELRKVRAEYKEAEEEAEYADWMLQGAERKMDVAKERIKGLNLKKRLLKK